jgi:hypothetical protein
MGICPDMSHRPEIKTEHVKREHVDDAVRALARLLARQVAAKFRMSRFDKNKPAESKKILGGGVTCQGLHPRLIR